MGGALACGLPFGYQVMGLQRTPEDFRLFIIKASCALAFLIVAMSAHRIGAIGEGQGRRPLKKCCVAGIRDEINVAEVRVAWGRA